MPIDDPKNGGGASAVVERSIKPGGGSQSLRDFGSAAGTVSKETKKEPGKTKTPNQKSKGRGGAQATLKRTMSAPAATLKRAVSAPPPAILQRKRSRSGPKSKSSSFIGVSQYRRTGRWEAHIWDCAKSRDKPGAKGRQLHLGSFDCAEDAARAYDRAAIHFRGRDADTNYPREQYTHDPVLNALKKLNKEQFVVRLRGVAQHHKIQTKRKNKDKGTAGTTAAASKPRLSRTASMPSYPLQSPHSVLPNQNAFSSDDYVDRMSYMYHANGGYHNPSEMARRASGHEGHVEYKRLPYGSDQSLVYRGRVLNARSDMFAIDLHQCQSDLLSDPNIGHSMDRMMHQMKQQQHDAVAAASVKNSHEKQTLHFFDESLMPFPDPDEIFEMQAQMAPEGTRVFQKMNLPRMSMPPEYCMQSSVEDYHLFEENNNIMPDLRTGSNRYDRMLDKPGPSQQAFHDRMIQHWERASKGVDGQLSPLMEGMGEVDTGTA